MVKNAIALAIERGLNRKNPVHQAEEYRVPISFTFAHKDSDLKTTTASGSTELEARPSSIHGVYVATRSIHVLPQVCPYGFVRVLVDCFLGTPET